MLYNIQLRSEEDDKGNTYWVTTIYDSLGFHLDYTVGYDMRNALLTLADLLEDKTLLRSI